MKYSYHNHTYRCGHAFGTEEEYIQRAISGGIEDFGFADHAPQSYRDFKSPVRMAMHELPSYVSTLSRLRDEYSKKINIHIGLEAEFMPAFFEKSLECYRAAGVEYLILGQHCTGNEPLPDWFNAFLENRNNEQLTLHVDTCIKAMRTGLFSYVAHPDVFHYMTDNDFYISEIDRLITEAKRLEIPLEINLLGLSGGRYYPRDIFWERVGKIGAKAVIGTDAHQPERAYVKDEILKAYKFADMHGVELLERPTLRSI